MLRRASASGLDITMLWTGCRKAAVAVTAEKFTYTDLALDVPHPLRVLVGAQLGLEPGDLFPRIENLEL